MENNRKEYRRGCLRFGGLTAVLLIALSLALYFGLLTEDPSGMAIVLIGVLASVVFFIWHVGSMNHLLDVPEMEAEPKSKSDLTTQWGIECGVSFGGVYALIMLLGTSMNGQLGEALSAIVIGCPLIGLIVGFVVKAIARFFAPREYRPWKTYEGYAAYLKREEERKRKAAAQAARYAQSSQNRSTYSQPTSSPEPAQSTPSASSVRGRIYRNGSEVGFYTSDAVFRGEGLFAEKLGNYRDGTIDDDSGIISRNIVGRYEWSSVYNGYLIYAGDSRSNFIGRVLRSGTIEAAKQPEGLTEIVLQGTEYTTIGRFTGDPEGAAAAAYLLLFH